MKSICTVELVRANTPAMAAGNLFRKWNHLRMQVMVSAGNDCLRFSRVTGWNKVEPADSSRDAISCVPERTFPKLGTFLSIKYQRAWPKLPLAVFEVIGKLFKLTLFPARWTSYVGCSVRRPKKWSSLEIFSLLPNWSRTGYCYFFNFQNHRVKEIFQAKTRFRIEYRWKAPCIFDEMYLYRVCGNHGISGKEGNPLVFNRKVPLKIRQSNFAWTH